MPTQVLLSCKRFVDRLCDRKVLMRVEGGAHSENITLHTCMNIYIYLYLCTYIYILYVHPYIETYVFYPYIHPSINTHPYIYMCLKTIRSTRSQLDENSIIKIRYHFPPLYISMASLHLIPSIVDIYFYRKPVGLFGHSLSMMSVQLALARYKSKFCAEKGCVFTLLYLSLILIYLAVFYIPSNYGIRTHYFLDFDTQAWWCARYSSGSARGGRRCTYLRGLLWSSLEPLCLWYVRTGCYLIQLYLEKLSIFKILSPFSLFVSHTYIHTHTLTHTHSLSHTLLPISFYANFHANPFYLRCIETTGRRRQLP